MYLSEGLTDKGFFPSGSESLDGMIHNDHLGTPQKMTDASGVVRWSADYKPFGEATVDPSSTITNNLRFPGQYFDAETGLNYNYYRDYNPAIGRYIESDPLNTGSIRVVRSKKVKKSAKAIKRQPRFHHLYGYVRNNPLRWIDPLGLQDACTPLYTPPTVTVDETLPGMYTYTVNEPNPLDTLADIAVQTIPYTSAAVGGMLGGGEGAVVGYEVGDLALGILTGAPAGIPYVPIDPVVHPPDAW